MDYRDSFPPPRSGTHSDSLHAVSHGSRTPSPSASRTGDLSADADAVSMTRGQRTVDRPDRLPLSEIVIEDEGEDSTPGDGPPIFPPPTRLPSRPPSCDEADESFSTDNSTPSAAGYYNGLAGHPQLLASTKYNFPVEPGPEPANPVKRLSPFGTSHPLFSLWDDVLRILRKLLVDFGIKYTSIDAIRIGIVGKHALPIIWIGILPETLSSATLPTAENSDQKAKWLVSHILSQVIMHFPQLAIIEGNDEENLVIELHESSAQFQNDPFSSFDKLPTFTSTERSYKSPDSTCLGFGISPPSAANDHGLSYGSAGLWFYEDAAETQLRLLTCSHVVSSVPFGLKLVRPGGETAMDDMGKPMFCLSQSGRVFEPTRVPMYRTPPHRKCSDNKEYNDWWVSEKADVIIGDMMATSDTMKQESQHVWSQTSEAGSVPEEIWSRWADELALHNINRRRLAALLRQRFRGLSAWHAHDDRRSVGDSIESDLRQLAQPIQLSEPIQNLGALFEFHAKVEDCLHLLHRLDNWLDYVSIKVIPGLLESHDTPTPDTLLGCVCFAPPIHPYRPSDDPRDKSFVVDVGVIEVAQSPEFRRKFYGNVIDLAGPLKTRLWPHPPPPRETPNAIMREINKERSPPNQLLPLKDFVSADDFQRLCTQQEARFVVKVGASTGFTVGHLNSLHSVLVNYDTLPLLTQGFEGLWPMVVPTESCKTFSLPGDSGSAVVDVDTGMIFGLLSAGHVEGTLSYLSPSFAIKELLHEQFGAHVHLAAQAYPS